MNDSFAVLIVDDIPEQQRLLQDMLSGRGLNVAAVSSGEEALARLARQHVDLLLTDLIMPRMDGMELLAQVRLRHPQVEIIMLTSFADVRSAVEAMRQGAFSYFRKGGDPRELLAEIAKVQELVLLRHNTSVSSDKEEPPFDVTVPIKTLSDVRIEAETQHILSVLRATNGNRTHAARILGISYRQLCNRLNSLDI